MSLYKQLWLAIILLMVMAFCGSFLLSTQSAKNYLVEQLHQKNIDNVSALALSLSQEADPVMLELLISAQFDSGHYQSIILTSPTDKVLVEKTNPQQIQESPEWFMGMFPIEAEVGIAQVSDGWRQIGTLTLQSHSRFAYAEMWRSTKLLFIYFLAGALISGLIGNRLLKIILKPLDSVVDQAIAIGDRRFITIEEPKTREYRLLVHSMNNLSKRIKKMLQKEGSELDVLRQQAEKDRITNLLNRGPFLTHAASLLRNQQVQSSGAIILLRLERLAELNRSESRSLMDSLLKSFGETIQTHAAQYEHNLCGRLNGSDFVLLLPNCEQPEQEAQRIQSDLLRNAVQLNINSKIVIATAAGVYQKEDTPQSLLIRADAALAAAEMENRSCIKIADYSTTKPNAYDIEHWRQLIGNALKNKLFELQLTPVIDSNKNPIYLQSSVALPQASDEPLSANQLQPWLLRLELAPQLDLTLLELAFEQLLLQDSSQPQDIGISLSAQLFNHPEQLQSFINTLQRHPEQARHIRLSIPEYGAYQYLGALTHFCKQLKPLACKIGIEQVGPEIANIGQLTDLGLDYVIINTAITRDIDSNTTNQIFLRGLCTIVHSIGLQTIADEVITTQEWNTAIKMGVDAAIGEKTSH